MILCNFVSPKLKTKQSVCVLVALLSDSPLPHHIHITNTIYILLYNYNASVVSTRNAVLNLKL